MLVNVLRTQARTVFASCRNITPIIAKHGARRSIQSLLPGRATSRSLLTSGMFRNEARLVKPIKRRYGSDSSVSPTETLYMGNIPYSTEPSEIEELLKSFGPIREVRIAHRSDGTSLGYAHVEFENVSSAEAAYESHMQEPFFLLGRNIKLDYAARPSPGEPNNTLYFSHFTGSEAEIRNIAGELKSGIVSVFLLQDSDTGVRTGTGFLEFRSVERATEAMQQLNGTVYEGRAINVKYARKTSKQAREGGSVNRRGQRAGYGGDWEGGRRSEGYQQNRRGRGRESEDN